jgi:hypothetical protein
VSAQRAILVGLVLVDLVPDLRAGLAPAKLTAELETRVPVNPNLPPVYYLQVQTVHRLLRLLPSRILNETETARSLLDLVQTHYQVYHLPALAKELQQLTLIGIE